MHLDSAWARTWERSRITSGSKDSQIVSSIIKISSWLERGLKEKGSIFHKGYIYYDAKFSRQMIAMLVFLYDWTSNQRDKFDCLEIQLGSILVANMNKGKIQIP